MPRFLKRVGLVFSLLLMGQGIVACVGLDLVKDKRPYLQEFSPAPYGVVCSVAVLPFSSKTGYNQAGRLFYRIFMGQLVQAGSWQVTLEGDIRKIYRQMHLAPWVKPTPEQIKIIASRLGVERVIGGEILSMEEKVRGKAVEPKVEVRVCIYDGSTGKLLVATIHRREGEEYRKMLHFGLVNSITGLSKIVVQEILTLWEKKGLVPCLDVL
ncbi:MAG TPA: hypothetical protein HPP69_02960 [Deltaproteobacteria bacterium]|nr:hypothetical protein [Deltaproteobacteria bacterium]